ncbi:sterol transporter SCDLUD_005131 [Saccharomycodes ludwigii]|uniref:sterol transporter n=1 Tax=Saccharomycodes ludwigii TaxID=36035 RepID=UPI001E8AD4B9|nr:hypothetical protein SCDLUD_005131 [Saccharomycodes ludwigii]KAH3898794.1 hypothetical protein SCDLUD_005131 [Saccharomycodes ludwigii]
MQSLPLLSFLLLFSSLVQCFPISFFNSMKTHFFDAKKLNDGADLRPINGDSPLLQCDLLEVQSLNINEIDLSPNPPVRGSELEIKAKGVLKSPTIIDYGSYIDVEVRLGYIRLISQTYDLCEQLEENDIDGLECPLQPGFYDVTKIVEIPQEVPPGTYSVNVRAYNYDDSEITCLTGDVTFP